MIVGQEKLLNKLNSYTLQNLPKTMLFIGEYGCGKKLFAKTLANNLNIDSEVISYPINGSSTSKAKFTSGLSDRLYDLQHSLIPKLCIIDMTSITGSLALADDVYSDSDTKKTTTSVVKLNSTAISDSLQSRLLKFIEEPSKNTYIILTAETESAIKQTIANRCIKYYFEPYTFEQLKQLAWNGLFDETVYKVCKTPGKLLNVDIKKLQQLFNLCKGIVANIQKASYSNAMTLQFKINYKEEYDKYDFNTFFDTLAFVAYSDYLNNKSTQSLKIYLFIIKYKQRLITSNMLLKENFVVSFLTELWEVVHEN